MTIRTHILDAGGLFGRRLPKVNRTVDAAVTYVCKRSRLTNVDLVVQPTDFGRDRMAVDAFCMSGHSVHVGIEREALTSDDWEDDLYRAVVHELHHALRWRHVRRWTVGEALVLEGLALLADQAAAGPQDVTQRPMEDYDGALDYIHVHRDAPIHGHQRWLYSPEPEQPGAGHRIYTAGHHLMRAALRDLHITPWTAARRTGSELLDAGLSRLRPT
ncbi:hypothetical protein JQC91_13685 [Jannaschia sp. Os4]|uniref:DUF2268 domain-containing putative Zn-dependent protease n=1 Tax=Jannaschia sp. Os4 TaxID=2807617 RepID=UPI00193A8DAA|nr:DUF2268 domain-containing putative Zn-dependent protease [Jannaschia sp. Os4]MBM2577355.1 hypothetical protein [Jannaschia sp. Os4]